MPSPAPDSLCVVLVRPRDPNNIGACARAMANFGLDDLRVVAPHPPVWREARSAVGAEATLKAAEVFSSLGEAVADCSLVLGTSAVKNRRLSAPVAPLPGLARPGGRTALVFGPEKTGLSAEELAWCSAVTRVPTSPGCPSMNLAAAVAVVCYELAGRAAQVRPGLGASPATIEARERVLDAAEAVWEAAGYRFVKRGHWRSAMARWGLTDADAGMLLEFLRGLGKNR